ncbi:MAG: hypothetical protein ACTSW4_06150 [Candidatus Ranarchaeia archaeon]
MKKYILSEKFITPKNSSAKNSDHNNNLYNLLTFLYRDISFFIEASVDNASALRDCPAVFDVIPHREFKEGINPLVKITKRLEIAELLVSMLKLGFPEMRWVISSNSSTGEIKKKFKEGFTPLFDPNGERNNIREEIVEEKLPDGKAEISLPLRKFSAAAIDEEEAYAYFNAYTAYRFGYRAWVITTWRQMKEVFGKTNNGPRVELLLEDLYLNFPDRPPGQHSSNLKEQRDVEFQKLKEADKRVLITVGHKKSPKDKATWDENRRYLQELEASNPRFSWRVLYKPLAGIFDLWKQAGLWYKLSNLPKLAEDFEWPPKKVGSLDEPRGGHSAPGRLLLIAQTLIDRAERILKDAQTVPDAIHAATLALEAKELLANKTPTTALEALSLQHQAEVTAECMFYGVSYNFDVKARFEDIKREVKAISRWFKSGNTRRRAELSARSAIIGNLVRIFREFNQFDEEQACLAEMRRLNGLFIFHEKPWFWPIYPLYRYVQFLLSSLLNFLGMVVFWILAYALMWLLVFKSRVIGGLTFSKSLLDSMQTFLTFERPEFLSNLSQGIKLSGLELIIFFGIPLILGFIHLGAFISHVYTMLQRR